jgi:hypothetical protein
MADQVEVPGYEFLGWGPRATSLTDGWGISRDLFGRCHACGGMLRIWPDESGQCSCGRLHKDVDAGRFGSIDGDESIAIYREQS